MASKLEKATYTFEGKRYWVYGKTKEAAREKAKVEKALKEAGYKEYKNSVLVKEWAYTWLEKYKEGTVSDGWYDEMESTIRLRIIPSIGHIRVKDVKPADISALYNKFVDKSFSLGSTLVQVTRQIFNSAEENDIIPKSPARFVKPPRFKGKTHYRILTPHERELFFKVAEKEPEDALFFLIMYYCGCRPQEVAALQMRDYDKKSRTLSVERARKADGDRVSVPKTEAGVRVIPVPDALADILDARDRAPEELIVTAPKGGMYTRSAQIKLWNRVKKAMEIAGGAEVKKGIVINPALPDDLKPYCFRHTFATNCRDMGIPQTEVKYYMGHTSIVLTADVYTHHSEDSFADSREKMNKYHNR